MRALCLLDSWLHPDIIISLKRRLKLPASRSGTARRAQLSSVRPRYPPRPAGCSAPSRGDEMHDARTSSHDQKLPMAGDVGGRLTRRVVTRIGSEDDAW
jgi:hypothetical protein